MLNQFAGNEMTVMAIKKMQSARPVSLEMRKLKRYLCVSHTSMVAFDRVLLIQIQNTQSDGVLEQAVSHKCNYI